jgi:hypothetical protein
MPVTLCTQMCFVHCRAGLPVRGLSWIAWGCFGWAKSGSRGVRPTASDSLMYLKAALSGVRRLAHALKEPAFSILPH